MIADMINNNKLNPVVIELSFRGRKLYIFTVFIIQSCFKVPKDVRLNTAHYFIMKTRSKRELQQIVLNHSSEIDFKDFMEIYKKYTAESHSFLVNDTTLSSDNPLRNRKKFFWNKYIIISWKLMIRLKMKKYNIMLMKKL